MTISEFNNSALKTASMNDVYFFINEVEDGNVQEIEKYISTFGKSIIDRKDIQGMPPISWAIKGGQEESLKALIKAGADVNNPNENLSTPALRAVFNNQPRCLEILFNAGADIERRDKNNYTPLMQAALHDNIDCTRLLLELGADPLAKDSRERTALDIAKEHNKTNALKILELDAVELYRARQERLAQQDVANIRSGIQQPFTVEHKKLTLKAPSKV